MIRPKRTTKPPTSYSDLQIPPSRKNSKLQKKKATTRAEFKPIPLDPQFDYNIVKFHLVCGDICLTEKNGIIAADMSVLSMVKDFKSVIVTQKGETKCVQVLVDRKETPVPEVPWRDLVKYLEESETSSQNMKDWAQIIRNFSLQHEDLMKGIAERNGKLAKNEEEAKEFERVTKETQDLTSELLATYPSFCFRLKLSNERVRLTEILFNELQVKDLGHSLDSFIAEVFEKGLPQIGDYDSESGSRLVEKMFENYFDMSKGSYIHPDTEIKLNIKDCYAKKTYIRMHLLKNYEDDNIGVDLIFSIVRKEDVTMNTTATEKQRTLNKTFIKNMAKQEKIKEKFLSDYYDTSFTLRYTHHEKVCTVKEIELEEEDIEGSDH